MGFITGINAGNGKNQTFYRRKLFMVYQLKIVFLLSLTLLLAACQPAYRVTSPGVGPVPNDDGKPPKVTIIVNGREQIGEVSTYCWPGVDEEGNEYAACVDAIGLATPLEPLGANSPLTVRFQIPMDRPPTNLTLQVMSITPEAEVSSSPINGARFWEPLGGTAHTLENSLNPNTSIELEPGLYVFTLFASWEGVGDAMHGFLIEVQ
jgi:hypothetical protein